MLLPKEQNFAGNIVEDLKVHQKLTPLFLVIMEFKL